MRHSHSMTSVSACLLLGLTLVDLRAQQPSDPAGNASSQAESRTWNDAAGKFSVAATLVELQSRSVRLLKSDGVTIVVPLEKLSRADRDYLEEFVAKQAAANDSPAANPFDSPTAVAVEPVTTSYSLQQVPISDDIVDLPNQGVKVTLPKSTPCEPLAADPARPLPIVKPGQCLIAESDAYDVPSKLVLLNTRQALVALSISRAMAGSDAPHRGRLFVGQAPRGPFHLVFDRDEAIQLLDHHAASDQSLLMCGLDGFQRGGQIVVMTGLESGKPVEQYRRRLPGHDKPGFLPQVSQARLIAPDVAVVVVDSVLYCWNLRSAEVLYRSEDNAITSPIAFSANAKTVAIPQTGGFNLLDTASGQDRGFVETGDATAPGVAFNPDGRRLAYCASNAWGVWDAVEAKKLLSSIVTEHLGNRPIGWIDGDLFLTDSGNLVDTKSQMLLWYYYTGPAVSQQLWYDSISLATSSQGLKLDTLPMLDVRAKVARRKLDKATNLMVTSPGTEVQIAIESSESVDKQELTDALTTAIERAGWVVKPQAKLTVVAKIGRGKPYPMQYSSRPIGGGGSAQGTTTSVEIKPFTAMLEIRSGRNVLWTRQTENRVPSLLFLRGDETVEQAVKKFERPQPEFFSSLQIPPQIPKAELARGLGSSRLDKGVWVDFPRP